MKTSLPFLVLLALLPACLEEKTLKEERNEAVVNRYIRMVESDFEEYERRVAEMETEQVRLKTLLGSLSRAKGLSDGEMDRLVREGIDMEIRIQELNALREAIENRLEEEDEEYEALERKWKTFNDKYDALLKEYAALSKELVESTKLEETPGGGRGPKKGE
jgi:septal ring factor EnvC (AmiA/AmiB activator)